MAAGLTPLSKYHGSLAEGIGQVTKDEAAEAGNILLISDKKVKTKRGRILIVGQGGVGKTSLKRSLFKEKHNWRHELTIGVDCFKLSPDISIFFEERDESEGSPTQKVMASLLSHTIRTRPDIGTSGTQVGDLREEDVCVSDLEEGCLLSEEKKASSHERSTSLEHLMLDEEDELQLLQRLSSQAAATDIKSFCDFSLWDFAGQKDYYTTHQAYMDSKSIYLFVVDANRDINDQRFEDISESDKRGKRQEKDKRSEDHLEFWLKLIHACSETSKKKIHIDGQTYTTPVVILVVTKKDLLLRSDDKDGREFVRKIRIYLAEKCEEAFYAHVLKTTFIVDNTKSGTIEEDLEIQKLRDCLKLIADNVIYTSDVPVKYLQLELVLRTIRRSSNIVPYESVIRNAKNLDMTEKVTDEAIQYFKDSGIVFLSKNLIILDTQWLTSFFAHIISIKSQDVEDKCEKWEKLLIDFRRYGILHEQLLNVILKERDTEEMCEGTEGDADSWRQDIKIDQKVTSKMLWHDDKCTLCCCPRKSKNKFCNTKNKKDNSGSMQLHGIQQHNITQPSFRRAIVMELLSTYDFVVPLKLNGKNKAYIFPSLIPRNKTKVLRREEGCCSHTIPLRYHFTGDFLQDGFYYRLVVLCLHKLCQYIDETTLKETINNHYTRFRINETHTMTLAIQGSDVIMVMWYRRPDQKFEPISTKLNPSKCVEARSLVEHAIDEIIAKWMPLVRPRAWEPLSTLASQ